MRGAWLVLCFATMGCSSAADAPPAPTQCNKTDRTGTYRATAVEQSGTCGAVDPRLVSFNDDGTNGASTGCTLHTDVWSEGDCKNERTFSCENQVDDSTQFGGVGTVTSDSVAVSRQQTQNGSLITGTLSIRVGGTSAKACQSVYSVTYERQ